MPKKPLPPRLEPKKIEVDEDPQVTTDLTISRAYDPQHISSLKSLGLIQVDGERFKSIAELGQAGKMLGLINLIHGNFMIGADGIGQAIALATRVVSGEPDAEGKVPTMKERLDAGKLAGYLGGQLAKVTSIPTKIEQARAEVAIQVDKQRRQSFAPGVSIPVEATVKPAKAT